MLHVEQSERMGMWMRLLVLFFTTFVLFTVTSYYFINHYQGVLAQEREVLGRVVKHLELNLNVKLMALQFLASDAKIKSLEPEDVRNELVRSLEILKFFNARKFDRQGKLVAEAWQSSNSTEVHDWDSFNQALIGNQVISDVIISEKFQKPYVSLRVPMHDESGQVEAVVAGGILLEELGKFVEAEQLPTCHYIFITDKNNKVIYYPGMKDGVLPYDFSRDMNIKFDGKSSGKIVDKSMADEENKVYIYDTIENSKWHVVMVIPLNEVYKQTLAKSGFYFIILLMGIVCAGLVYRNLRQSRVFEENIQRLRMERLLSVNQLAAGLAHEVRNPLTSIKGFVQLMSYKRENVPNQHHVDIILTEIDRIDRLLNEFQLLTRPLKTPNFVKINMEQLTHDVIMLMEGQAISKKVRLTISNKDDKSLHTYVDIIDGGLIHKDYQVIGEEAQLKQVLINLLKNAIDAAGENGLVDVKLSRRDNLAVLTVKDNGVGISDDVLKKIGTPFFTTKEGGNGLGLSVCYNIIESHGGSIEVESEVGQGTTFSVILLLAE